ncbi:GABA-specific permease [Neolecta irregularis DAH-3]|uniref:GABA-specific permease n=1 Tax=Neolecta irregularis (strain DAH-3) TaxID=1198029 RepID=A0A1U7LLU5_NEOID|nr:GABA-specific permease [Neolecta irregularis DAH-3]|eukprot:OLL23636.1 GABA-specific permease [Neolecta irregularis DAH-3]
MSDPDEAVLAALGYRQDSRRTFTFIEIFGLAFSVIGLVPSISAVLTYSLPAGPAGLTIGWLVASIFINVVGLSIAELASSMPLSAGFYFWTYRLSDLHTARALSFIVGWSTSLAQITGLACVNWSASLSFSSLLTFVTEWKPPLLFTYLVFIGLQLLTGVICSVSRRPLARLQYVFITANLLLIGAFCISLPLCSPKLHTAKHVFTHFSHLTGYSKGLSFMISFLAPVWVIGSFDSSVNMAGEAKNASVTVPWSIAISTISASLLGFLLMTVIAFCVPSTFTSLLASPITPFSQMLFDILGRNGALVFLCATCVLQWMVGISILIVASKQMWIFSKDGGLPFSKYLSRLNTKRQTPILASWTIIFLSSLLGLICLCGTRASEALFSLAIAGSFAAYSLPIYARLRNPNLFNRGPFHLGVLSKSCHTISLLFMASTVIILLFPERPHPNWSQMNYSSIVIIFVAVLGLFYWFFPGYGARIWYTGPKPTAEELEEEEQEWKVLGGFLDEDEDDRPQMSVINEKAFHNEGADEIVDLSSLSSSPSPGSLDSTPCRPPSPGLRNEANVPWADTSELIEEDVLRIYESRNVSRAMSKAEVINDTSMDNIEVSEQDPLSGKGTSFVSEGLGEKTEEGLTPKASQAIWGWRSLQESIDNRYWELEKL